MSIKGPKQLWGIMFLFEGHRAQALGGCHHLRSLVARRDALAADS